MSGIDMSLCPVQKSVQILNPDGTILVETNNDITMDWIRLQIAQKGLRGYSVKVDEKRIPINKYGNLKEWPVGMFDMDTKILSDLMSIQFEKVEEDKGSIDYWVTAGIAEVVMEVRKTIAEVTGLSNSEIKMNQTVATDLGCDGQMMDKIYLSFGERFHTEIPYLNEDDPTLSRLAMHIYKYLRSFEIE